MSTRSTVTIWYQPKPGSRAYRRHHLYRHHDGGLWGGGRTLAHTLRAFSFTTYPDSNGRAYWCSLQSAADRLSDELLDITTTCGRNSYETTTHADDHGDTEYHYDVFLDYEGGITWRYKTRRPGREWEWQDGGTVKSLRRIVATELLHMRKRINRRRAESLQAA